MLYQNAMDIISKRREDREDIIRKRKREVFVRIPRAEEIDKRLSSTGLILLSRVAQNELSAEEFVAKIMGENRILCKELKDLLLSNGYPENYLDPPYICPICSDTGYTKDDKLCSCIKSEITKNALKDANLTEYMAGQTFDKFNLSYYDNQADPSFGISARENAASILRVAKNFVESFAEPGKNLLFYGASGLGKTFLSSAIATELLIRGYDVLYISSNSLFPILENIHFGRGNEKSDYIAQKALNSDLLILDDLGAEYITQFTASELFRIMNHRLLTGKKMVFSTNLNLSDIVNSYSERIVSRMIGEFHNLRFFGEDIRQKKKYN